MVEIKDAELVFAFPDVDEEAILRIHFCGTESPAEPVPLQVSGGGSIQLVTVGRFVMHLRPNVAGRDRLYGGAQYPFAMLASVRGKNAITGGISTTLVRSPQNYFATPPQGGIDGYFLEGRVHPFRAGAELSENQERLEISVFPMKCKAFAYFKHQLQLIPGRGPSALRGIALLHGGERQCEPIYEDICSIGDWDTSHVEHAFFSVSGS